MERLRWPVVVFALAAPVATAWMLQSSSLASRRSGESLNRGEAAQQVATGPRMVRAGVAEALYAYDRVFRETRGLEAPAILPVPHPYSAGQDLDVRVDSPESDLPRAPKIDDKRKIAIFFSGNCIGELEPCG